jgi:hypothetical protein
MPHYPKNAEIAGSIGKKTGIWGGNDRNRCDRISFRKHALIRVILTVSRYAVILKHIRCTAAACARVR